MLPPLLTAQAAGDDGCRDLGHGFRNCEVAESTVAPFESLRHTTYLFYRTKKLSEFSSYRLTPTGDGIVFQAAFPTTELFLFRASERKMRSLTHGFSDVADDYQWIGDGRRVRVHLANSKKWVTVDVPPAI